MQSKDILKTAIMTLLICSTSAKAEVSIAEPFAVSNFSPLIKIHGLPTPKSVNVLPKGVRRGTIQASLSNNFSKSVNEKQSVTLDGESLNTELTIEYGIGNDGELSLVIPYLKHSGGNLDGFIEDWHSFFGLPDGGRRFVKKNRLLYQLKNSGRESFTLNGNSTAGLGDISFIFSKKLSGGKKERWKVSAGVKFPSGKSSDLFGSEFTSFFSMAHYSNPTIFKFPRLYFNQTLGILKNNSDKLFETKIRRFVYFGSSQIGWRIKERLNLKAQIDYHTPFYSSNLKQLGSTSAQLVLGGSIKVGKTISLDLLLSEDIATDTAPDVTFTFGLRQTF
ncbi:DUF3187 family protein [Gammaproteobacteria bacterium]|nr:DUF3187 family protein [Gammaproteobacteria bacterium]